MIKAENLAKRYRNTNGSPKWVLENVNFVIPPRTNVGIVGRNGAGKSTLLRIIGGSDRPSKGRLIREGRVSWPVGFGGGLQGSLTGRQNCKFVCRIQQREDNSEEIISKIASFADIGRAFEEPVQTYSTGMKGRLQFAMSLAFDFDVYISDEVTSVGDRSFKEKARDHFRGLAGKAGLIMVSHSERELEKFCDAGIFLHEKNAFWHDSIDDALAAYHDSLK